MGNHEEDRRLLWPDTINIDHCDGAAKTIAADLDRDGLHLDDRGSVPAHCRRCVECEAIHWLQGYRIKRMHVCAAITSLHDKLGLKLVQDLDQHLHHQLALAASDPRRLVVVHWRYKAP